LSEDFVLARQLPFEPHLFALIIFEIQMVLLFTFLVVAGMKGKTTFPAFSHWDRISQTPHSHPPWPPAIILPDFSLLSSLDYRHEP
jgi:hypothetical protein